MATNAVTVFDPKVGAPAHVAAFFDTEGSNIENRQTVPSLSPQGKQWTISLEGNKTTLMRNQDGDMVPVGVLKVVVLDYAKRRGRAYYEGAYDPTKEGSPVCWSDDGIAPPTNVPKRQSDKCENCPQAAKGSKIGDGGKAMTACSQHRMLAIVPANRLDFEPLRLKIAITSDWDKQSPDAEAQGWYGFQNYTDFLKARGVQHTAAVVTKMKFDPNAAYPKIFFAADRWLSPEELAVVAPITKDPKVASLLGGTWTPAGPDGVKQDEAAAAAATDTAAGAGTTTTSTPAPPPPPPPPPAAAAEEEDGDIVMVGLDAPADQSGQGGAQGGLGAQGGGAAGTGAAAAPAATAAVDPALESLLADWGN